MALKRSLGVWMLTALVTGNMIGSGVFLLPASLASYGSIGIVAWALTAVGAILLALMFSQFGCMMPKTGGPYAYSRAGFGDFIGFIVAYNYWIGLWAGNAAIAIAFVGYLSYFFPALNTTPLYLLCMSLSVVWLLTIVNIRGVKHVGIVQLIATVLKLIPLILIAIFGLLHVRGDLLGVFNVTGHSNISALSGAAALTFWSFVGVESATIPAGEVDNPERNIPIATICGTLIAAIVYILGAIAVMGTVPMTQLAKSTAPFADCAQVIFGPLGGGLVAIGAAIACFGTLNGWLLVQGQIPMAAADDKLFPSIFAKRTKAGTPVYGLIISSVLISILLFMKSDASLVDQFTIITMLATLTAIMPYFITSMAQLMVFVREPGMYAPKKLKRCALIAILSGAYAFVLIIGMGQEIVYMGTLLLFSSIPFYVWLRWSQSKN